MQTYLSDIIPSISRYSKQLNDETLLTSRHWVVIDEIANRKNIYIFRKNRDLLISTNGLVEKGKWDYLLALKIEGGDEYAFLVNEKKYDENLNSVMSIHSFLTKKYIDAPVVMTQGEDNEGWMMVIILIAITLFGAILILSVNFKP
jgi:hypothetical protein